MLSLRGMCWIITGVLLIVPIAVLIVIESTSLAWRFDYEWIYPVIVVAESGALAMLGVTISLYSLAARRLRIITVIVLGVHVVASLEWAWLLTAAYEDLSYRDQEHTVGVFAAASFTGLSLVLIMRMVTAWTPSIYTRIARITSISSLSLAIFLWINMAWNKDGVHGTAYWPAVLLIGSITIGYIGAPLTIAMGAIERRIRNRNLERTIDRRVPVKLECPKCGSPVEAAAGRRLRCTACRLGIKVILDEPRCSCGYLLYDHAGKQCPECGLPVPDDLRWTEGEATEPTAGPAGSDGQDQTRSR